LIRFFSRSFLDDTSRFFKEKYSNNKEDTVILIIVLFTTSLKIAVLTDAAVIVGFRSCRRTESPPVTSDFHGTTLGWSGGGGSDTTERLRLCDDCLRVTIRETSRGYSTILDCLLSFKKNSQTGLLFFLK
jgi:hypothetical protein